MSGIVTKGRDYWLWAAVIAVSVLVFLVVPGAASEKSRALLHGLCAQTPSHSFSFGGTLLPFDGRMTGIYGGSIISIVSLVVSKRVLFYGNPPARVVLALGAGVGTMAIDGFNSLLTDLQLWHPYTSRNELRLITGYLTGMALGVVLCWLLGSSMWRLSRPEAGVDSLRTLLAPAGCFAIYAAIVMSDWTIFLVPVTVFLVLSSWVTLSTLMLVVLLLVFRYEDQVADARQLHIPGAVASAVALAVIIGLAGGRFWLERALGLPALV